MPGEALTRNKELFRALIENSNDAITLITLDGTITYANSATARLTGYSIADLEGMNSFAFIHPDDQKALKEPLISFIERIEAAHVLEYRLRHRDGYWKWAESTLTNLLHNDQVGMIMCNSRDVTQHKQLLADEQAAHIYAERKFRSLVESDIVGIMVTDQEGRMYEVNHQLTLQLGYSQEELLSGNIRVKDIIMPQYRAARARAWKTLISQGTSLPEEKEYIRKDGTHFPALVAAATIDQEHTRALVMLVDISDRRETERRQQEFLGMVSHELRTPLTAIQGFLELTLLCVERITHASPTETRDLIDKLEGMLHQALRQAEIETRLVAELLDVSRMERQEFAISLQQCNLVTLVQQVVANQQQMVPTYSIELALPAQTMIRVEADPDRIEQVLTNYLTNALKYSTPAKDVRVQLSIEGLMARVSVHDQGPGLTVEQQNQVWDRFYQVKDNRSHVGGMGLGLYIARTIIAQHQGQVGVESYPGQGATFWFMLPILDELMAE